MGRSPRRGGRSRSAAAAAAAWLLLSLAVGAAAAANGSLAGALRRLAGRSNSCAVCCVAAATGLPAAVCSRRGCTCEARLDLHCTSRGSISAGVPGPSGVHQHRTRGPYEWQRDRLYHVSWHTMVRQALLRGAMPCTERQQQRRQERLRRPAPSSASARKPTSPSASASHFHAAQAGLPVRWEVRRKGGQMLVAAVAGGPVPRLAPGGGTARSLDCVSLSWGACLVRERRRERRGRRRRPRPAELRAAARAEPAGGGPPRAQPGPGRGAARAGAAAAGRARARRAGRGHRGARRHLRRPGAAAAGAALWRRAHRGAGFPPRPDYWPCLHA